MYARLKFNIIRFEVMEIGRIRKELTELLENIVEHSTKYAEDRALTSLEVSVVLTKINHLHERMSVLKYLLEAKESEAKHQRQQEKNFTSKAIVEQVEEAIVEEPIKEIPVVQSPTIGLKQEVKDEIQEMTPLKETANVDALGTKITKLMDSLTLNDRYLYANELFNKDMNAFNELVKKIDACTSFDEVQKLFIALDWEIDNEHVLSFSSIIERRFSNV